MGLSMAEELIKITSQLKMLDEADSGFAMRSAVASFLFLVMPVDGETHPKEYDRLKRILSDDFEIDEETTLQLIHNVETSKADGSEMVVTASILKAGLTKSQLLTLVSHMWEMVFADGVMHESEVCLIERVADLLELTPAEVSSVMTN